jgi:hypothetical protein
MPLGDTFIRGPGEGANMAERTANRIPIWIAEYEVGGGLPAERTYQHSFVGEPIGYIVLPDGMQVDRRADHLAFSRTHGPDGRPEHEASLGTRRAVEAAVAGEFDLSWQPYGSPAKPQGA